MKNIINFIFLLLAGTDCLAGIHFSDDKRINAPLPNNFSSVELFVVQKGTGLINPSIDFFINFRSKLKQDLETYRDALDSTQIFLIKEFLARLDSLFVDGEIIDEKGKYEIINQLLEIAQVYYSYRFTVERMYPVSTPRHPLFDGLIHPYWNSLVIGNVFTLMPPMAMNLQRGPSERLDVIDPEESAFWTSRSPNLETYNTSDLQKNWCNPKRIFDFASVLIPPEEGGEKTAGVNISSSAPGVSSDAEYFYLKFGMNPLDKRGIIFQAQDAFYETGINALYNVLGFNVDTGVFCPSVTLRFHPGLLSLSKSKFVNRKAWDIQYYYQTFILKDGTRLSFNQAMNKYVYMDHSVIVGTNTEPDPVELDIVKPQYDSQIEFVQTYPVYLEKRLPQSERVMSWSREGLSHEDRRELRGLILADTWLGVMDNYGANLKVIFEKSKDTPFSAMKFALVDSGSAFTSADFDLDDPRFEGYLPPDMRAVMRAGDWDGYLRLMKRYSGQTDLELQMQRFSWSVFLDGSYTKKLNQDLKGSELINQLGNDLHLLNNQRASHFLANMTVDDLKWMTRKIGALKEWQIYHALAQTGLGHPGALLVTEKLLARRDQLVTYFDLESELGLLRPQGPRVNLNASGDNVIMVNDKKVQVPSFGYSVKNGEFFISD